MCFCGYQNYIQRLDEDILYSNVSKKNDLGGLFQAGMPIRSGRGLLSCLCNTVLEILIGFRYVYYHAKSRSAKIIPHRRPQVNFRKDARVKC